MSPRALPASPGQPDPDRRRLAPRSTPSSTRPRGATTEHVDTVERYGIVRQREDKNAALLPHRVDREWVLLHRPKTQYGGARGEILRVAIFGSSVS